nr:MAG TPA: hypothetical protein [Caudoviricetes sp.]DAW59989.1 MAG TPA: hypothetical protein [Caudoviricetes sp.]
MSPPRFSYFFFVLSLLNMIYLVSLNKQQCTVVT